MRLTWNHKDNYEVTNRKCLLFCKWCLGIFYIWYVDRRGMNSYVFKQKLFHASNYLLTHRLTYVTDLKAHSHGCVLSQFPIWIVSNLFTVDLIVGIPYGSLLCWSFDKIYFATMLQAQLVETEDLHWILARHESRAGVSKLFNVRATLYISHIYAGRRNKK